MTRRLSVVAVAPLTLALAGLAAASPPVEVELDGPATVRAGERAHFVSRTGKTPALEARSGDRVRRFDSAVKLEPGKWEVRAADPSLRVTPRTLVVEDLPPRVARDAPLPRRLACVQVFVWDGGATDLGRTLESAGRRLAPVLAKAYAVSWTLSGRQATRENVDFAISELAARGYVIDLTTAVHGFPLKLADGAWTEPGRNADLRAVRLHYTTACWGAGAAKEFLDAGVGTFVAARGKNFVSALHLALFVEEWSSGKRAYEAIDRAFEPAVRVATGNVLEPAIRAALGQGRDAYARTVAGTRPVAFGDTWATIRKDPALGPTPGLLSTLERAGR